ncbi:MAG TPA: histidinol-phosphatase HisJ family protein [Firmicutes bacterium]|nr:histidinol-phosphatase HisJ family protein [Bacillota bacterium]
MLMKNANIDFHTHTAWSPDSEAAMDAMCASAEKAGLYALAITDHVEIPAYRADGYDKALAGSFREAGEMQAKYAGRLRIARGVELGEPLHDLPVTEELLAGYAFDVVIGSLHNLKDDQDFYYYDYTHTDVLPLLDRYFEELLDMVRWGRFHILAHLTYPFRYFPEEKRPAGYRRWQGAIDAIFRTMAERGLALEINVSGLRQTIGRTLPDLPLVRRFRELGGELVTVGSDAHAPQDIARPVGDGLEVARQAGFRYVAAFFGGRPELLPIG